MLPLEEIDRVLPQKGHIIELGCGEGVIARHLAKNKKRQVLGIDLDVQRITDSKTKNLKFKVGDITAINYKSKEGFVISDVLHHLSFKDQNIFKKSF